MPVVWEPELDEDARHWRDLAAQLTASRFEPLAAELDRDGRYPWESVEVLVESGLAAMFVPEHLGGGGASLVATCAAVEEVARGCASTAAILSVYVLGAFPILLAGSDEQVERLVSGLAGTGEATSFALTEKEAGSDAGALTTSATRTADGWHLAGEKIFIGNGGASRWYVVFARTDPDAGSRGISAFVVDREAPGVTIDRLEDKMGLRGTMTSNLVLDADVPDEALVGEEGAGLRLALRTLNVGRISVAAQALGLGLAAFDAAARRAVERRAFGSDLLDKQGVGFRLADVATELSAARMLTLEAARAYDAGGDAATLGAMAKLYATEASHRAVDAAVQVFGGYGYIKPYPVERYYRDQRVTEIYEGTSEIQRLVISRAIRAATTEPGDAPG